MGVLSVLAAFLPLAIAQTPVFSPSSLTVTGDYGMQSLFFKVKLNQQLTSSRNYTIRANGLKLSACTLTFTASNWNVEQTVYVQPTYTTNFVNSSIADNITVTSTTTSRHTARLPVTREGYVGQVCSVSGDPHFIAFNGGRNDYQSPHTMWVLQTPRLSVQCQSSECWTNGGMCLKVCSVQYTDGVDTGVLTVFTKTGDEVYMKVIKDSPILKRIQTVFAAKYIDLTFPDGAYIRFSSQIPLRINQETFINMNIRVPPTYRNVVNGMCGTGLLNTLTMPIGTNITDLTRWRHAWTIAPDDTTYNQLLQILQLNDQGQLSSFAPMSFSTMYTLQNLTTDIQNYNNVHMTGDNGMTFMSCPTVPKYDVKDTSTLLPANFGTFNNTNLFLMSDLILDRSQFYPGTNTTTTFIMMKRSDSGESTNEMAIEPTLADTNIPISENDVSYKMCAVALNITSCENLVKLKLHVQNCAADFYREYTTDAEISNMKCFDIHKNKAISDCSTEADSIVQVISAETTDKLAAEASEKGTMSTTGLSSAIKSALSAQLQLGTSPFTGSGLVCASTGVKNEDGGCDCQSGFSGLTCDVELQSTFNAVSDTSAKSGGSTITISTLLMALSLILLQL